jgi:hypothetical protein
VRFAIFNFVVFADGAAGLAGLYARYRTVIVEGARFGVVGLAGLVVTVRGASHGRASGVQDLSQVGRPLNDQAGAWSAGPEFSDLSCHPQVPHFHDLVSLYMHTR